MKYKTIFITGTTGFIGFHTAKNLLKDRSCKVVGVDNMNDYYDIKIKQKRNSILKKYPNYKFYKINIADYKKLDTIARKEKLNAIIHLAAQAGVRYSLTNPWAYEESNSLGTMNIFELAKNHGIKRVLFASSSSVYGKNIKSPFKEVDPVDHPISIYAASKKANEVLAHSHHHLYGIETAGMRFFTVYGEYGRPDMALFKFTKNILLDKPIDVYNKGQMMRDFTHVDDIVAGILGILNKKDLKYEIYNLGGDNPVRLMDFIGFIEKKLGKKAKIDFLPLQQGDVVSTIADVSKAKEHFGFKPRMGAEQGVGRFVDWFLENKNWLLKLKEPKQ